MKMDRQDVDELRRKAIEIEASIDRLQRLRQAETKDGVTVDSTEYGSEQETLKQALKDVIKNADELIDKTDKATVNVNGAKEELSLPNAKLSRADLPEVTQKPR